MEKEFQMKIQSVADLATKARKRKKLEKNEKVLTLLSKCKEHEGPLTANDISIPT